MSEQLKLPLIYLNDPISPHEELVKISSLPDVAKYVGVGDGSIADAVTALIGTHECMRRMLTAVKAQLEKNDSNWLIKEIESLLCE